MTQQQTIAPVNRAVTVPISQERAFKLFAEQFGTWWPKEYHIGQVDMADFVVEPRAGGRWYEVGVDGSECQTGHVLAYEPPARLCLAWQLNGNWQYDSDPSHASEVEVRFIAEGPNRTRVELEHRAFERHGADAAAVHGSVDNPSGWTYCLDLFARRATA